MIRTRNFRARNERIETRVLVKSQTGKNVSVERRMGARLSVESTWAVFKRRLLQFQPRESSWTTKIQVPSTSRDGACSLTVISRGPSRHVMESYHDREKVSSTSVEQSHAGTSSIEETHASKPQKQSSLMNCPSKESSSRSTKRTWNDIPACDNVVKYSLVIGKSQKV